MCKLSFIPLFARCCLFLMKPLNISATKLVTRVARTKYDLVFLMMMNRQYQKEEFLWEFIKVFKLKGSVFTSLRIFVDFSFSLIFEREIVRCRAGFKYVAEITHSHG